MAEVKKKVELDIKSNIDKILKSNELLSKSMAELTKTMSKFAKDTEGSYSKMAKESKDTLSYEKQRLAILKEQKKQVDATMDKYRTIASVIRDVGTLNFGGLANTAMGGIKKKIMSSYEASAQASVKAKYQGRIDDINARSEKIRGLKAELSALDPNDKANKAAIKSLKGRITYNTGVNAQKSEALAADMSKDLAVAKGAGAMKGAAALGVIAVAAAVAAVIVSLLKKIDNTFKQVLGTSLSIKDSFNDIITNASKIASMYGGAATYSASSTLITNSKARQTQLKYGLSDSQNYALTQTMGILGMTNDEDLMYMNREQVQLFRSFTQKYDSWYSDMKSSGALQKIQEFQLDFAMFKQELAMDFMSWFAENKDTLLSAIKSIAKFTMSIANAILKITQFFSSGLSKMFGSSDRGNLSSAMSDYASYNSSSSVKNINIHINQSNSATGVLSSQSALQEFYNEQTEKMIRETAAAVS